jgi:hypothetical protein
MRDPHRTSAPQRKYTHARVLRACMHQHVHVKSLEQRVGLVRRCVCERYECHFERFVACAGVRYEGYQDGQDLLQAVVTPERYIFCFVCQMVSEGGRWVHVPPSSTFMLLESAWTTESCSGPKGCAGSLGCWRSSMKGARRKERYGVMSDCCDDRSQHSTHNDPAGRCGGGVYFTLK